MKTRAEISLNRSFLGQSPLGKRIGFNSAENAEMKSRRFCHENVTKA